MNFQSVARRRFLILAMTVATAGAVAVQAVPATAGIARGSFRQTNLVSDIPGMAQRTDPLLVNPWGISASPTSPLWVSDNNAGVATVYTGAGVPVHFPPGHLLVVGIPLPDGTPGGAPTGNVFNGSSDFVVSSGGKSGVAFFLFATEDGTIAGWAPNVDFNTAIIAVDNSTVGLGAVYKGLAIGNNGSGNFLYASNFRFGTVDVFDGSFTQVNVSGAFPFADPNIPTGFAPFNIQNLGGVLYVTYAKQNAAKHDDVSGPGNGFVDVYDLNGNLLRRLASQGTLNSPWGLAIAPSSFGNFHNDLLVGDFGDGRINAFDPTTGRFHGQLKSETSAPIAIQGLWGLRFGNDGAGGSSSTLFFTAGINEEKDGLFGTLVNVD